MVDPPKTGRAIRKSIKWFVLLLAAVTAMALLTMRYFLRQSQRPPAFTPIAYAVPPAPTRPLSPFQQKLVSDLQRQIRAGIRYQDGYYQGGEPPASIGVCTDVLIRSFRAAGVDLHKQVADDIRARPRDYHITRPDPNIDHRRCHNLVVFFRKKARSLPISGPNADWQPGDIVIWDTANSGKTDHCGMIGSGTDQDGNPTVVHHWPGLPVSETDGLYRIPIRYHFRYFGPGASSNNPSE